MIKVEPTKNIITGTTESPIEYLVENLPPELQQVILMLDDWREREANLQSEMNMVATAINAAKNTLLQGITSMEQTAAEPDEEDSTEKQPAN